METWFGELSCVKQSVSRTMGHSPDIPASHQNVCSGVRSSGIGLHVRVRVRRPIGLTRQTAFACLPMRPPHIQRRTKRLVNLAKQDPGRAVKQEQEENSPNHLQAF